MTVPAPAHSGQADPDGPGTAAGPQGRSVPDRAPICPASGTFLACLRAVQNELFCTRHRLAGWRGSGGSCAPGRVRATSTTACSRETHDQPPRRRRPGSPVFAGVTLGVGLLPRPGKGRR